MFYARFQKQMNAILEQCEKTRRHTGWVDNPYFGEFDAMCLFGLIRALGCEHYIEIGSGYSTIIARKAMSYFEMDSQIICIDPEPRASVGPYADTLYQRKLKVSDWEWISDTLNPGDILFMDGSHRMEEGSDVQIFWNCIYEHLKPGVGVHMHDIFLPNPYPADWAERHYNEQYMLLLAMQMAPEKFDILLANGYLATLGVPNAGKSFWFTKAE